MKKRYFKSSSFVIFTLSTLVIVVAGLAMFNSRVTFNDFDFLQDNKAIISSELHNLKYDYQNNEWDEVLKRINWKISNDKLSYALHNPKGEVILSNIDLPHKNTEQEFFEFSLRKEVSYLVGSLEFKNKYRVFVCKEISDIKKKKSEILFLNSIILGILIVIVVCTYLVSIFVVSKINDMAKTVRNIMVTGELSERIPIFSKWDDLSYLSKVFNEVLDYLEILVRNIRNQSNVIAHNLRTPLTGLKIKIDQLENCSQEEKTELNKRCDDTLWIFNKILKINEVESGSSFYKKSKIDLKELLEDIFEMFQPVAEDRKVQLNIEVVSCTAAVDSGLIVQALINLLENALKFTPEGGSITIRNICKDNTCFIVVADSGVGIKDSEKSKALEKFYKSSDSSNANGYGLGLSMVKSIVDLHQGEIVLSDNNPGLIVTIKLPN